MKHWNLASIDVQPRQPQVIETTDEGRAVLIQLPAGEKLQDHEVHERAWLTVVSGEVLVSAGVGNAANLVPGELVTFDPKERHEVSATTDALLLLLLTPWPGVGHPSETKD